MSHRIARSADELNGKTIYFHQMSAYTLNIELNKCRDKRQNSGTSHETSCATIILNCSSTQATLDTCTHPPSDTPSFMTETTKWKHLPETKRRKRLIWYLPREFFVMRNHSAHIHLSAHWQSIALRDHLSSNHSFCPLRRFMQESNWLSRMQFDATLNTPERKCISRCILHIGKSCYWCFSLLCHFLPLFCAVRPGKNLFANHFS